MDDLVVDDRTETILEVKKILTKKNLIVRLEEKCHSLDITVNRFFSRIEPLTQKGLSSLFVINDKLITRQDYVKKLSKIARDTAKFSNIKGTMTGKAFLEALSNDLFIQHEVNHIFVVKPNFSKYTKVDEIYRKVSNLTVPDED